MFAFEKNYPHKEDKQIFFALTFCNSFHYFEDQFGNRYAL